MADSKGATMEDVPIQKVVTDLVAGLGIAAVIRLSQARDGSQEVNQWLHGTLRPPGTSEKILRMAYEMFTTIVTEKGAEAANYWFRVSSCVKNDRDSYRAIPIYALYDGHFEATRRAFNEFMGIKDK